MGSNFLFVGRDGLEALVLVGLLALMGATGIVVGSVSN
jgi:hypothetical protein